MRWILSRTKSDEQATQKARFATGAEIKAAVERQRDFLYWISLLITGNEAAAEKSVVDASGLSSADGGVFADWLDRWASHATARSAVGHVRELIAASVRGYVGYSCPHSGHEFLADDQIARLRGSDPRRIVVDLDTIARSVLVLRGIQRRSVYECALLLNVPRGCVVGAYCNAIRWVEDCLEVSSGVEQDPLAPAAGSMGEEPLG